MTRFYVKYADFKVAFDYLLAECPSGLPTLDATLRTARVGVTGRESQPYIVLLNNSQLFMQDLEWALLTGDVYVLQTLLAVNDVDYAQLRQNVNLRTWQHEQRIRAKFEEYQTNLHIRDLEITGARTPEEFSQKLNDVWGANRLNRMMDNLPKEANQTTGFIAQLLHQPHDVATTLLEGLRRSSGCFYVNQHGRIKSLNGACKMPCGDMLNVEDYPFYQPSQMAIRKSIYWSPMVFLVYAAGDKKVGDHFKQQTGLEPHYTSLNQTHNEKIMLYIVNEGYNLHDKPIPNNICMDNEGSGVMYESRAATVARIRYVNMHMSNGIDSPTLTEGLHTLPIPIYRESSLLLLLADLAISNNCDPFAGIFEVKEVGSKIWIVIILVCLLVFVSILILLVIQKGK